MDLGDILYYLFSALAVIYMLIANVRIMSLEEDDKIVIRRMTRSEFVWLTIIPSIIAYGMAWLFRIFL